MSALPSGGPVVGRERELAAVRQLLTPGDLRFRALVAEGEPGIGKTKVWRAGIDQAAAQGMVVLSCRPVEAEAKLAFAGLGDLLAPVVERALDGLPTPQREALEVAMLRATPGEGASADGRALGMAVQSLLRQVASVSPVLVAIDDVQWLDRASSAALAFACRRLHDCQVRVLAALRVEAGEDVDVLGLSSAPPGSVERLRLGPLSLSGLYHVIRAELGSVFPRPTLVRIEKTSRGNPLFALELARELSKVRASPGPGAPLPVPGTLAELLGQRVRRLSLATQEALLVAASLATPEVSLVEAALGREAQGDLDRAERAGVARVRDGRVHFDHPLLAAAVQREASPQRRRAAHRALAAVVAEPEQHARHLALAASEPEEEVATALDTAATAAAARGAPEVAVELAELACASTPSSLPAALAERRLRLAEYRFRAGDGDEACRLAKELVETLPRGTLRAAAAELLARVLHVAGTAAEAAGYCLDALTDATSDRELEARMHATLALVSWHDFRLGRHHAQLALRLLDGGGVHSPEVQLRTLMAYVQAEFYAGHELPSDLVERGLELERLAPAPSVADRLSAALGAWLKYQGDYNGARYWLESTRAAAEAEGDDSSLPYALSHLPQLELWAGNWERAKVLAYEHMELATQIAQPSQRRQALYNLSLVQAHMGLTDEARAAVGELLREAEEAGDHWDISNALAVSGFLELSLGEAGTAAAQLSRSLELRESMGTVEPLRSHADYVEALLHLGRLDQATDIDALLSERAAISKREPLLAVAARSRALLASARGDLDGAGIALSEAKAHHERVTVSFDLARTLMVGGQISRRQGQRKAARAALERARAMFQDLGAPLWEARAQAELRRIPVRRGAPTELTPTERSVAELAASGRTNREVAKELFISPKTVEVNLARAYRKLGVTSRAQLGAVMAARAK
ncbi:MAG TPA: AAA family ATPase [Acidimicrobiales bacterium]|nr:AAA family ATPase [Acidimicrobiales bacterium]